MSGTDDSRAAERRQSLWLMVAGPFVWLAHFVACYVTAAVRCAGAADPGASVTGVRFAIAAYTAVALASVAVVFWIGVRWYRLGNGAHPLENDTARDRTRFLGFATALLGGLSGVAVAFVGAVGLFVETCL